MQKNKLSVFRKQVEKYFELEFSDLALKKILCNLPEKYLGKVEEVIELHYRNNKLPANAAAYAMRIIRGPCRNLIIGLDDESPAH